MARFGIRGGKVRGGTGVPVLRRMAKLLGRDQELGRELWASGILEARILASLVADPAALTCAEAELWLLDVDNWAVCDALCGNVLDRTPYAYEAAVAWASRGEEFVKRAAFSLMAQLAVHDKAAEDARFEAFLPLIVREAPDRRNFVRKAVNWALRQIGKRNPALNAAAVEAAHEIKAGPEADGGWRATRCASSEATPSGAAFRAGPTVPRRAEDRPERGAPATRRSWC
jgi:3-methyladenine DNA glycosylase AlkD